MPLSQFDYVGFDEQSSRTPSTGKARRAPAHRSAVRLGRIRRSVIRPRACIEASNPKDRAGSMPFSKARASGHKGYANFRGGMLVSIPMPDRHWQHRPARRDAFMGAIIHHMLDRAPAPVAPFSHAVETDGWVFVTGQIPENPDNEDEPLPVGIEAQTRRVMDNLKLVLSEIGLGLEHVVSARAFLIDMREFETMNKIYASYFPPNKRPARTCIGVTGLAKAARVEIDFIARRP
jgi:2-iminobutanoate/2-iminopropanoate deaminase